MKTRKVNSILNLSPNEVTMRSVKNCLLLAGVCCLSAVAQDKKPVERPPDLSLTTVGRQHHPIQTKNAEAQQYFDQGVTLLYGFNHEEAARAFRRAGGLDPASPMPLWGVALAAGPNYNLDVDAEREKMAFETMQKARKLAEQAPQVEKDYVAALAVRYSGEANPNYKKLALDYTSAMGSLSQRYPDDLDAATLYAESLMNLNPWKLWSLDGQPWERTEEIVQVLESVLKRDPNHAGANHLYIHALEASPHAERALPSAKRLETMVPNAGHMVHMPAHIYIRTGDYAAAAKNNEDGVQLDKVYLRENGTFGSTYDILYYSHNLHFLSAAYAMAGNFAAAKRAADELEAHIRPMVRNMPMSEFYLPTPIFVLLRFHRWNEILKAAPPEPSLAMTSALWHFARGSAAVAKGQISIAAAERKVLGAAREQRPAEEEFGMFFNKSRTFLDVAANILDARLAMANGNDNQAIEYWENAVRIQDGLNYGEPPEWFYPVRESLGAALLASGKATEAEQVFREDLRRNPRNPRSLFGLMHSLKAQQKEADAAWVEREFHAAWKNADTKLQISDL
jgi:tetratricopeptide (TPR) repeat protein